jgi:hypothetical protein
MQLQERDLRILTGLFESRLMTLAHITALYFEGKRETAKKRVQILKNAGLIRERPRRVNERSILFLGRAGFNLAKDRGYLSGYPAMKLEKLQGRTTVSDLTLNHELAVMDVKATLSLAIAATRRFHIAEFTTWPALNAFHARPEQNALEVVVKPDGFIRIHETEGNDLFEHTFYLEVDRSTETQAILAARIGCYLHYYRAGGLAIRFGHKATDFQEFPFRTLVVFQNSERRNNMAEQLLLRQPAILTHAWLTTMPELLADPLGPIWIRPFDYRLVTENTPFAPGRISHAGGYRRQTEREVMVQQTISKHSLLIDEKSKSSS